MSLDQFSPEGLVAQFICATKGNGHFLSPIDYGVIQRWLINSQGNPEPILLILEDQLPQYYANNKNRNLNGLEKRITKLIQNWMFTAGQKSNSLIADCPRSN